MTVVLKDVSFRTIIRSPTGAFGRELVAMGATSIIYDAKTGARRGVYVDNETPKRDRIAKALHAKIPNELVVVGLEPNEAGHRITGCLSALEWYPFPDQYVWDDVPRGEAGYIVQYDYAWPGDRPPTVAERTKLLKKVQSYKPRIIWAY